MLRYPAKAGNPPSLAQVPSWSLYFCGYTQPWMSLVAITVIRIGSAAFGGGMVEGAAASGTQAACSAATAAIRAIRRAERIVDRGYSIPRGRGKSGTSHL